MRLSRFDAFRRGLRILLLAGLTAGPAAGAAAGVEIRGKVLDAASAPLGGASLTLLPALDAYRRGLLELSGEPLPETLARAETDRTGEFLLRAPEPGYYQVRIAAPGFVSVSSRPLFLLEDEDLVPARLKADDGPEVSLDELMAQIRAAASGSPEASEPALPASRYRLYRARSENRDAVWGSEDWQPWFRYGRIPQDGEIRPPATVQEVLSLGPVRASRKIQEASPMRLEHAAGQPAEGVLVGLPEGPTLAVTGAGGLLRMPAGVTGPFEAFLPGDLRLPLEELKTDGASADSLPVLRLPELRYLRGVVADPDGEPVAGAFVYLRNHAGGFVVTDRHGRYSLPWGPHRERLLARKRGYLDTSRRLREGSAGVDLVLVPAVRLQGIVEDEEGRRIAGARVTGATEEGLPSRFFDDEAESDAEGRFRLEPLNARLPIRIRVRHEGFAPFDELFADPRELPTDFPIVLSPGSGLFGRLLGPDGQAIDDARILAYQGTQDEHLWQRRPKSETSSTGGVFRFTDLAPGNTDLLVQAAGLAPRLVEGIEAPGPGEDLDLGDLSLEEAVYLEGRVVGPRDQPIPEAQIYLSAHGASQSYFYRLLRHLSSDRPETESDTEGNFALPALPEGLALGLRPRKHGFLAAGESAFTLEPAMPPVRLVMEPARLLRGTVMDGQGRPVAGADVLVKVLTEDGSRVSKRSTSGQADRDGRFEFSLEPRGVAEVSASHDLRRSPTSQVLLHDRENPPPDLRLVLAEPTVVEGVVVDGSGQPREDVWVSLEVGGSAWEGSARTDARGTFEIGARAGTYRLLARDASGAEAQEEVTLAPGDRQYLRLVLEGGHGGVSGRLFGSDGRPLAHTALEISFASEKGSGGSSSRTDAEGRFSVFIIFAPPGHLSFRVEGFAEELLEISESDLPLEDLEIHLGAGATISGAITGLPREQLLLAQVHAFSTDRQLSSQSSPGRVLEDGTFEVPNLGPGVWEVSAQLPRTGRRVGERLEVVPGQVRAEVDLHFPDGWTLTGTLLKNGAPAGGAFLSLQGAGGQTSVRTQRDGSFRFEGVSSGSYELAARFGGRPLEVAGDREILLELFTAQISGRVLAEGTGSPIADARVQLQPTVGALRHAYGETQRDGAFALKDVGQGAYDLSVQAEGYASHSRSISVRGSIDQELEVFLQPGLPLVLTVANADGSPPPEEVSVSARDLDSGSWISAFGPVASGGQVTLTEIPPGRWEIFCRGYSPETAWTRGEVEVPGGPYPILLEPQTTLLVSAPGLDSAAQPLEIHLFRDGTAYPFPGQQAVRRYLAQALARGGLPLDFLPPSLWTVEIHSADGRVWRGQARTTLGETVRLELEP